LGDGERKEQKGNGEGREGEEGGREIGPYRYFFSHFEPCWWGTFPKVCAPEYSNRNIYQGL